MLYYLKYTNHEIEKLHELLVFFFDKVDKEAPTSFDHKLLFPSWYSLNSHRLEDLEKKLEFFFSFDKTLRDEIVKAFKVSHEVDKLFYDINIDISIAKNFESYEWEYTEKGKVVTSNVANYLDELFVKLYKNQLSKREKDGATFSKMIKSDITKHYSQLIDKNQEFRGSKFTVCPFCGIEPLKMVKSEGRPDYDHLLPKGSLLYVFSAVNLKNLVPIGNNCNYLKKTKNLLYLDDKRTKRTVAFYPYEEDSKDPFELIEIVLDCIKEPKFRMKGKWAVSIKPKDTTDNILKEKIESWDRVFNIRDRYAEYLETDNSWIEIITSGMVNEDEIKVKIKNTFSDIKLSYSFIAIEQGIMLKEAFYKWVLYNESFIPSFFKGNELNIINSQKLNLSDLE